MKRKKEGERERVGVPGSSDGLRCTASAASTAEAAAAVAADPAPFADTRLATCRHVIIVSQSGVLCLFS
jgi:hypothetical protein